MSQAIQSIAEKIETFTKLSDRSRVLTLRDAIVACSVCRNQATRAISDAADQIEGFTQEIGSEKMPAAAVMVAPDVAERYLNSPATSPRRVQLPTGIKGKTVNGWVGVATLVIAVGVDALTGTLPENAASGILRAVGNQLRQKSANCCREQCEKRMLPRRSRFTSEPHKAKRRRG